MKLVVITSDANLARLCRDLLRSTACSDWMLSTREPGAELPPSDLYLWDYEACRDSTLQIPAHAKFLFLVHPADLDVFRRAVRERESNILLKPITRAVLAAYLVAAMNSEEAEKTKAHSLKADRDEMLQCLIQANLRLQEYDQERTNFLIRAIHDFRASLTALSGYCGLLLSEALGELSPDQGEVIRRMQHSTNRLNRMATGMFELGISRRVQKQPELRHGDIQECLEQASHEIGPFARDKKITVVSDVAPTPANLYFDQSQLEQLLINLLDNACKFTPRGGLIEIKGYPCFIERRDQRQETPIARERRSHASNEPNAFRMDIRDSGTLIPQDQLQRIFEEYTSSGGKQDRSGGGLGLAICRFIVEQHGGRIWASNTESGPLFSFTLPLRTGHTSEGQQAWTN